MRLMTILAAVGMLAAVQGAHAELVQLRAEMTGLQSVPPTPSPGTGVAEFQLDTMTGGLTLTSGSYQDLIGIVFAAHVHGFSPPGEKSGTLFTLAHTGGMSGTLSLPANQIFLKESEVQGMLNGLTYIALHTTVFNAGEIRGQIYVVPAPAGLALLGLLTLTPRRRRKR